MECLQVERDFMGDLYTSNGNNSVMDIFAPLSMKNTFKEKPQQVTHFFSEQPPIFKRQSRALLMNNNNTVSWSSKENFIFFHHENTPI